MDWKVTSIRLQHWTRPWKTQSKRGNLVKKTLSRRLQALLKLEAQEWRWKQWGCTCNCYDWLVAISRTPQGTGRILNSAPQLNGIRSNTGVKGLNYHRWRSAKKGTWKRWRFRTKEETENTLKKVRYRLLWVNLKTNVRQTFKIRVDDVQLVLPIMDCRCNWEHQCKNIMLGDSFKKCFKLLRVYSLTNQKAARVTEALRKDTVFRFGIPLEHNFDQGWNFHLSLFQDVSWDGMDKQMNQTINVVKVLSDDRRDWVLRLHKLRIANWAFMHESTGHS